MDVGFIGIGRMGSQMARYILEGGYDLTVHDLKKEAATPLLEKGANVNRHGSRGSITPLHAATKWGRTELINLLLSKGARVNELNGNGQTPLDYAVSWNKKEAENLLRSHGAKTGEELREEAKAEAK